MDLNIIDLIAFLLIFLSVIGGIRNGFTSGFLDLLGLAAGIYLAFKGNGLVSGIASDYVPLPRGVVNLGSLAGLFIATQIVFALILSLLSRVTRRLLGFFPFLRLVDSFMGILPGLVKGSIGVMLAMLFFGLFPIIPEVKGAIEESYLGSRLIPLASEAVPRLESFLGQTSEDSLAFVSRPEPDSPLRLNFPVPTTLTVDPVAEQKMLDLVNAERKKEGLQPLVMDDKLQQAARGHSQEMFELSYFAHESPAAGDPANRMRAAGAKFATAAENLAYAPNVEMAHSGLMNSPGHRKNILTPGFKRVGIGVIDGGLRGKMFTQNFTD